MPVNPILAYFDQGQVPHISCVNKVTNPQWADSYMAQSKSQTGFEHLIWVLQKYVDDYITPVWGITCILEITDDVRPGTWGMVFTDDADVASALGYHDLTRDGFPLSNVFVETSFLYKEEPSVTAAHELAEMLLDPGIQMGAQGPNGVWYAYELCDPCERETFLIEGVPVSDFVYPAYFEGFRKPKSAKFDYLGKITKPFQILRGGYMPVFKNGKWTQVFASKAEAKKFEPDKHPRMALRRKKTRKVSKLKTACV